MNPHKFFEEVSAIIGERGHDYGGVECGGLEENFDRAARIANQIIGRALTPHDIAMVMVAVKLARMRTSPDKRDSYIDCAAYLAFAAELKEAGR